MLSNTTDRYYHFLDIAVGNFSYSKDDQGIIQPLLLTVNTFDPYLKLTTDNYYLSLEEPYGPFVGTYKQLNEFFNILNSITLSFTYYSHEPLLPNAIVAIQIDTQIIYQVMGG